MKSITLALEATKDECPLSCKGPYFLFQTCPALSGQRWYMYSIILGILYLLCLIPSLGLLIYYRHLIKPKTKRVPILDFRSIILCLNATASLSSGLAFLIDPFYTDKIIHPVILGILYGLRYPCMNSAFVLLLFFVHDMVDSFESFNRRQSFLPKTKVFFLVNTFLEFATQLFADTMRGLGFASPWLVICQFYFLLFGTIIAIMLTWFGHQLRSSIQRPHVRNQMRRFFICFYGCAICAFAMSVGALIGINIRTSDDGNGKSFYFFCMLTMRCFEMTVFILLTVCLLPANWS